MDANSLVATFLLAQQPPGGADMLGMLVPLIMVMGVFYLLIWRPQAKAAQKHLELVNALKVGDEVVTDAGVFGKVSSVDGDVVTLEISKGVKMRIRRKNIEGYQGQAGTEEAAS
ncbi:MAG: preprotein translocase subunit YajC [bacterium]